MSKMWFLCISEMPTENGTVISVKVLSSEDVPAKGEKLYFLARTSGPRKFLDDIRTEAGDDKILEVWRQRVLVGID